MDTAFTLLALLVALSIGAGVGWFMSRRNHSRRANETTSHVSLEGMRAIGELSVFKAITKEIVTETDYSFGEFGRKYLRWAFSQKKLAMIFEFQIDFRYDLRSPQFQIDANGAQTKIQLPPVKAEISVRSLRFYDEQRSKFMPWLLPDLLNGAFGPGFSEVETSARATLIPLAQSFGAKQPQIAFSQSVIEVDRTGELRRLSNNP
jgi:hypothetical protein